MGSNCLKKVSGKVIVDEKSIKDFWKEYTVKLMNEQKINRMTKYQLELKKNQQTASGLMKLLQH